MPSFATSLFSNSIRFTFVSSVASYIIHSHIIHHIQLWLVMYSFVVTFIASDYWLVSYQLLHYYIDYCSNFSLYQYILVSLSSQSRWLTFYIPVHLVQSTKLLCLFLGSWSCLFNVQQRRRCQDGSYCCGWNRKSLPPSKYYSAFFFYSCWVAQISSGWIYLWHEGN